MIKSFFETSGIYTSSSAGAGSRGSLHTELFGYRPERRKIYVELRWKKPGGNMKTSDVDR